MAASSRIFLRGGGLDDFALGRRSNRDQGAGHRAADIQILGSYALHVLDGHFGHGLRPIVDLFDGHAHDQPLAVAPRQRSLAVGLVDELGDEGLLGPFQLIGRDRLLAQIVQHCIDRLLDLVEVDALCGGGVHNRSKPLSKPPPEYQPPAPAATLSSATSF